MSEETKTDNLVWRPVDAEDLKDQVDTPPVSTAHPTKVLSLKDLEINFTDEDLKNMTPEQTADELMRLLNRDEKQSAQNETLQAERRKNKVSGLENELALEEDAEALLLKCIELNLPVGLIMIDIDQFKTKLNDVLGHDAGDQAIRETGRRLLKSIIRKTDKLVDSSEDELKNGAYNLHGDEYAVLLPNSSTEGIGKAAQRIAFEMQARSFVVIDNDQQLHDVDLTVSQGGYLFYPDKMNQDEIEAERQYLIQEENKKPENDRREITRERAILSMMKKKADAAQYVTKRKGKNGFNLFDDDNPFEIPANGDADIPR